MRGFSSRCQTFNNRRKINQTLNFQNFLAINLLLRHNVLQKLVISTREIHLIVFVLYGSFFLGGGEGGEGRGRNKAF